MDDLYKPELFRHSITLTVRFADVDGMGHVNNAKYLTYLEQARLAYVMEVWEWEGGLGKLGMIMARAEINFQRPMFFNDQLEIFTRCSRLGNKSFDLAYLIRQAGQPIVATGLTTIVAYDYAAHTSIPVPAEWRERTLVYEPALS